MSVNSTRCASTASLFAAARTIALTMDSAISSVRKERMCLSAGR